MMAMWAAVPPKLIQPSFHQKRSASAKRGVVDGGGEGTGKIPCNLRDIITSYPLSGIEVMGLERGLREVKEVEESGKQGSEGSASRLAG
jgi:hypothetical protein